jgi:ribosomal protein S18 acetylase RimI-like enzyme
MGTIRIDLPSDRPSEARLRLIAIKKEFRGQGHGLIMMTLTEVYLRSKAPGRTALLISSAPDAVPFYEKLGYHEEPEHLREHPQCPLMVKYL